jgi:acyl carrier protein
MNNTIAKILELAQKRTSISLNEDTDLFRSGYDSLMIMELVVEVESLFNIEIPPEGLSKDRLRSVAAIAASIQGLS